MWKSSVVFPKEQEGSLGFQVVVLNVINWGEELVLRGNPEHSSPLPLLEGEVAMETVVMK